MLTQPEVTHALICGQSMGLKKADVEYCTNLAIDRGCTVEINKDKNYDGKAGQARNGVNLSMERILTRGTQRKALSSRTHIVHR